MKPLQDVHQIHSFRATPGRSGCVTTYTAWYGFLHITVSGETLYSTKKSLMSGRDWWDNELPDFGSLPSFPELIHTVETH